MTLLPPAAGTLAAEAKLTVLPTSLVTRDDPPRQQILLWADGVKDLAGCRIEVDTCDDTNAGKRIADRTFTGKDMVELSKGKRGVALLLPEPAATLKTRWTLLDPNGKRIAQSDATWQPPRHWTLYVVKSAHIDIGLHEAQYYQRWLGNQYLDDARRLADQTAAWPEASRFRCVVEGTWWWSNYPQDRSERAADETVRKQVKPEVFGIAASHSGNRTEVYSTEELCRTTYCAQELRDRWKLTGDAMLMVDNNGITWPLVTAYADAGVKYLGFFPNAWNPSTTTGPDSKAGGSRIDVGWDSPLPHLFYWQGPDTKSRVLVWANPHYWDTASGISPQYGRYFPAIETTAVKLAQHLARLEARYPYDTWLVPLYCDNEPADLRFPEIAKAWNARWRWPQLRTTGDLAEPFRKVEARFGDKIPTLRGTITAGWAQHPPSTPTLLASKYAADRLLATAETLASLAGVTDRDYIYPTVTFRRAWDALICNDEHGYGTSGYKGRRVFDTWLQKRDWIERAWAAAETESARALTVLAASTPTEGPAVFVFNPTLHARIETVEIDLPQACAHLHAVQRPDGSSAAAVAEGGKLRFQTSAIPSLGYAVFRLVPGVAGAATRRSVAQPPVVENDFYRVTFATDGSIAGIFDKQLSRELIDTSASCRCNQFLYTKNVHKSFASPGEARFEIESSALEQTVIARMEEPVSGAALEQRVTLPAGEKRIDLDNRLEHVRDLSVRENWHSRFGYYAFPWAVPQGEFRIGLNGCAVDPYKDQTGHGTDAYHAARDWSHVGNRFFGVTLVQHDTMLVECGKIHPNKKAVGEPPATSHLYSYVCNDWLYDQAYNTGPITLRCRYAITSHRGGFEQSHAARFAQRVVTPVLATVIARRQPGSLPSSSQSFLSVDAANLDLLTLKRSEAPGRGLVARLHETDGLPADTVNIRAGWGNGLRWTQCSVSEQDRNVLERPTTSLTPFGYSTLRIEAPASVLPAPQVTAGPCSDKAIALRWTPVNDVRQYHVYRGENADFAPDVYHLLGTTAASAWTDDWLGCGRTYYYRVAAAGSGNQQGTPSEVVQAATNARGDSPPAKVGTHWSGLISDPRAWRSDTPDTLYLLWGQNTEPDLSHYELYRGPSADFVADAKSFLATVQPGPYVVVPYEDKHLQPGTTYYYRVRAVDRDGHQGAWSAPWPGVTREALPPGKR